MDPTEPAIIWNQPYTAPALNESLASKPGCSLKHTEIFQDLSLLHPLQLLLPANQRPFLITLIIVKLGLSCSNNESTQP